MSKPKIEDFIDRWTRDDGQVITFFENDKALGYLLQEGICFINSRPYIINPWNDKESWQVSDEYTTVVFMNCNDVFPGAHADAVEISGGEIIEEGERNELYELLKLYLENSSWGHIKWVCLKRNMKPDYSIIQRMKKDGYWDEELENLPFSRLARKTS